MRTGDVLLSLDQASRAFRTTRETLRKRLHVADVEYKPGGKLPIYTYHVAMVGDLHAQKIRLTTAQADIAELERKEKEGELVTMDAARQVISERFIPLRTELMALPSSVARECNQDNPEEARKVLAKHIQRILEKASEEP